MRGKRKKLLKKTMRGRFKVKNWLGTITDLRTSGDGRAILAISLAGGNGSVQTWTYERSDWWDLMDLTLIPQGGRLFQTLSELSKWDEVRFSGSFVRSGQDFFRELSITEGGSMARPEFIFRFTQVKPRAGARLRRSSLRCGRPAHRAARLCR